MSGFLGAGKTQITTYSGLQVQTTSSALPVPICYGVNLLTPNVVWYNNFQQHGSAGGKGGGKGGLLGSSSGLSYSAAIIMALCEGPILNVGQVWTGSVTPVTLDQVGLSLYSGTTGQTPWPYVSSSYPDQALSYAGTAYLCATDFNLGPSASVGNNSFELYSIFQSTGFNGIDADPAFIIQDFLTDSRYGCGFPAASIDLSTLLGSSGDSSYQTYCWAVGLAISPFLVTAEKASQIISRWLQLTNSTAVWSGGELKIIPFGDQQVTGNGRTWVPNVTPIYDLTDEDFLYDQDVDPIKIQRTDPFSAYNQQSIEIQSRSDQYNTGPIYAFDQSAIDRFGLRIGSSVSAHEICDLNVARTSVQLVLQRQLYVRRIFTFKLSWEFCALDPMDLVTLTDVALGLNKTVVRIIDIEEDDTGLLTITAEEFPAGVATATLYPTQAKSNGVPNLMVAPGNVNPPYFFEPPYQFAQGLDLVIGLSGQDPATWGGCTIYVSSDDLSFSKLGVVSQATRMGFLTAPLPAVAAAVSGNTVDSTNTLAVSLTESGGTLAGGSQADLAAFNTASVVDGEVVAYQNAALTGANAYNLSPLYRGGYGSPIQSHATGAPFMRLDGAAFRETFTTTQIGQTFYFKFASFNTYQAADQTLDQIGSYKYVVQGSALSDALPNVQNIRASFNSGVMQLYWDEVSDFRTIQYEIRKGASWASALPVVRQAHPPFVPVGDDTYWIAAVAQPAPGLTVYSATPESIIVSGSLLSQYIVQAYNEGATGWTGTLSAGVVTQGTNPNAILVLNGSTLSGTYVIPDAHIIDVGYVAQALVGATFLATGTPAGQDILALTDFLGTADILGSTATQFTDTYIEISIAQAPLDVFALPDAFAVSDVFTANQMWSSWQKFQPGVYVGRLFRFRATISTQTLQAVPNLQALSYQVTVPARIDHYVGLSVGTSGQTIVFTPDSAATAAPFNGGPNGSALPTVKVSYQNQPGDSFTLAGLTTAQVTLTFYNSSVAVARTATVEVQGY